MESRRLIRDTSQILCSSWMSCVNPFIDELSHFDSCSRANVSSKKSIMDNIIKFYVNLFQVSLRSITNDRSCVLIFNCMKHDFHNVSETELLKTCVNPVRSILTILRNSVPTKINVITYLVDVHDVHVRSSLHFTSGNQLNTRVIVS